MYNVSENQYQAIMAGLNENKSEDLEAEYLAFERFIAAGESVLGSAPASDSKTYHDPSFFTLAKALYHKVAEGLTVGLFFIVLSVLGFILWPIIIVVDLARRLQAPRSH